MAASLVAMVAKLTIGKKKYAEVEDQMREIADEAEDLRVKLQDGVKRDADSFDAVMDAFRLPKDTDEKKAARLIYIDKRIAQLVQLLKNKAG